jgi:hypothetical protein
MNRYRKKPVVVEAYQWHQNGDHPDDHLPPADRIAMGERTEGRIVRYFRHPDVRGTEIHDGCGRAWHDHGWIDTLEGGHNVCPGDWIITGIQGEHYPCKPDIFEATYEPVEPS